MLDKSKGYSVDVSVGCLSMAVPSVTTRDSCSRVAISRSVFK